MLIPSYKPRIKILNIRDHDKFFSVPHLDLISENMNIISVGFTGPIRPNILGLCQMKYGYISDQNYDLIMGHWVIKGI